MYYLHKTTSAVSCVKPNASHWEATLRDGVGFATVYRRIYRRKFLTLSNQTSCYIRECIRICIVFMVYVCSICACLVLFVFSSSWCLGRAAACDCGTPWTSLLHFFMRTAVNWPANNDNTVEHRWLEHLWDHRKSMKLIHNLTWFRCMTVMTNWYSTYFPLKADHIFKHFFLYFNTYM